MNLLDFLIRLNEGLQLDGGKQDQYAVFGGLNLMRFWNGDQVEVVDIKVNQAVINLELMLVLFYTSFKRVCRDISTKTSVEEKA